MKMDSADIEREVPLLLPSSGPLDKRPELEGVVRLERGVNEAALKLNELKTSFELLNESPVPDIDIFDDDDEDDKVVDCCPFGEKSLREESEECD